MRALLNKKVSWFWDENIPWLKSGDIPADPLGQLETRENELSVFEIYGDRNQIERVAAALALGRQEIDAVEFILFDESMVDGVGIKLRDQPPGKTCDREVNSWHRRMIEISGDKLLAFAKQAVSNTNYDIVPQKRVKEVIIESLWNDKYDLSKANISNDTRRIILEEAKRKSGGS